MMTILAILVGIATVLCGLLAGVALDHVIVQFPARHKLGIDAFADYKRAADTGNGLFLYPALAIGFFIFTVAAALLALASQAPNGIILSLALALILSIGVLITTAFAAPIMLHISKMSNKEKMISVLIERFIKYSYVRAIFIWLDALVLLYALVAILRAS